MRITRITHSDGEISYYIEYKHWLFGWEPLRVSDRIGDGWGPAEYKSYQKAIDALCKYKGKSEKAFVIFEEKEV